jgi:hypothetical protein
MHRSLVGLLAAAGATVSVLAALAHGDVVPVTAATAGLATGLGVYLSLPSKKLSRECGIHHASFRTDRVFSDGSCQGWA